MIHNKNVYIIGGINGSGKTTVAKKMLPEYLNVFEYVNADEIAAGLSHFNPESVAFNAGRLMLERLEQLVTNGVDFAFETTLSGRIFVRFLKNCKTRGYTVNLIYFWLNSPELAILRVRRRVESGGHNISEDVIRRRYKRGISNLIQLYLPLCDTWIVYDNSSDELQLVAEGQLYQQPTINQPLTWKQIIEVPND